MAADEAGDRVRVSPPARWAWPRRLLPNAVARRRLAAGAAGVLLTFDDGPHPDGTPEAVARLAEYGVRGLFFVVGRNLIRFPDAARAAVAAGHEIGNHSFAHARRSGVAFRAARADVAACQKECDARLGVRPAWFRPPMGVVSPAGLAAARANGLGTMTWSLDANDWQCRSAAQAAACGRAAAAAARPGDIVLFHDGQPWIGHVLAAALPALRRRGLA